MTVMDARVAGVTESVVVPDTVSDVAVIVVVPVATDLAKPEVLIVTALVLDEFQITEVVKSCVKLSEYIPVAINC